MISEISITFKWFPVSFAAWAKLFLHHGQAETSTSAPTSLTSSNRCFAEKEASCGKASFVPRPAPQQKAFSLVLGISTNLTPGMAFRIFLGCAYSPSVPRRLLRLWTDSAHPSPFAFPGCPGVCKSADATRIVIGQPCLHRLDQL